MGLPQENVDGYRLGSPINFAEGLKGKLLIIHGIGRRQRALPGDGAADQSSGGVAQAVRRHGVLRTGPTPSPRARARACTSIAQSRGYFSSTWRRVHERRLRAGFSRQGYSCPPGFRRVMRPPLSHSRENGPFSSESLLASSLLFTGNRVRLIMSRR